MTVNELYEILKEKKDNGWGNKPVLIDSSDSEYPPRPVMVTEFCTDISGNPTCFFIGSD